MILYLFVLRTKGSDMLTNLSRLKWMNKTMKRKDFLKLFGGAMLTTPVFLASCYRSEGSVPTDNDGCPFSPSETKGPFPIHEPGELVKADIVSDRVGVPLLINLTVQNDSDACKPLADVLVDVWHCDSEGNYSEYGGGGMQPTDYQNVHFLRGRQTTDANGNVSFISIYPGWYQGRATHVHVEVLDANSKSLVITQIAFPENITSEVYRSTHYEKHGQPDTTNQKDDIFRDTLERNMGTVTGSLTSGFILTKAIIVKP